MTTTNYISTHSEINSEDYITQVLLSELREVNKVDAPMMLLTGILQGIEGLGALLDDKPLKAKGQGGKRFGLALRKLFPSQYAKADREFDLYGRLRNHLTHVRLTAKGFEISDDPELHLSIRSQCLKIHSKTFFIDFERACERMIELTAAGKTKNKKISAPSLKS